MRLPFLELPGATRIARPVVPVELEGLEMAPFLCLVDTGALHNRLGADLARVAGISLDDPVGDEQIAVAGFTTRARCVRTSLTVAGRTFDTPVWFCDHWPLGFGLLGQEGFLRFFRLTLCAAQGWLECVPEESVV